jgi:hypothetical protein
LRALNDELAARQYRVTPHALWPAAMGRISRVPTLLQRFLRRGNADALADHIQGMASSKRASTSQCDEPQGPRTRLWLCSEDGEERPPGRL